MEHGSRRRAAVASLVLGLVAGAGAGKADELGVDWPEVPARQRLLGYLGTSLVPLVRRDRPATLAEQVGAPPFAVRGDRYALDLGALDPAVAGSLVAAAATSAPRDALSYEEAVGGAARAYLVTRPLPDRLADLGAELGLAGSDWTAVDVDSAIAGGVRRIRFRPGPALGARLAGRAAGTPLVYPVGTVFLAEELDPSGRVEETHVVAKRVDQAWDFALYDAGGRRRIASHGKPRRFQAPATCFACHQGAARVSPFREFPGPGPVIGGRELGVRFPVSEGEARLLAALRPAGPVEDRIFGDYAGIAAVLLERAVAAGGALTPEQGEQAAALAGVVR